MSKFVSFLVCLFLSVFTSRVALATGGAAGSTGSTKASPAKKEITSDFCAQLKVQDIPVGNFQAPLTFPMETMRVTQHYNTSKEEGYCLVGSGQFDAGSKSCKGKTIHYGHDGLDLHPKGTAAGKNAVYSIQPGQVIASHANGQFTGWGESVVVVSRANAYSEELLTFHYHHLYTKGKYGQSGYQTSRLVNACDQVSLGQELAKEGGTPNWPTHLHLSVKRWASLTVLQDEIVNRPSHFYGSGYTYGDSSKIKNFLDPEALLYGNFREFQEDAKEYQNWQFIKPYVDFMRSQGWEFGLYDGSFGLTKKVLRREAARYFKQAAQLNSYKSGKVNFQDLALTDSDYVYVESLLADQRAIPILNPTRSCISGGKWFCGDNDLNRAEALKMTITAFYQEQFVSFQANLSLKGELKGWISFFQDVNPTEWYAPYVAFGLQTGLINPSKYFYPENSITRAELSIWLYAGYKLGNIVKGSPCGKISCPQGKYCDPNWKACMPIPTCLPSENNFCEYGGGQNFGGAGGSSGNNAGGGSGSFSGQGGSNQAGMSNSQGGQSGQNGQTGAAGNFGSGGSAGGNGGNSGSGSAGICQKTYLHSPQKTSCYSNNQASGAPTLCLDLSQISQHQWQFQVCKLGSTFGQDFSYEILDQNHLSHYLGNFTASAGKSCTPWQKLDFSYLNMAGPQNGAALQVMVRSPSSCTHSTCTYYPGLSTVYYQCLLLKSVAASELSYCVLLPVQASLSKSICSLARDCFSKNSVSGFF